MEDKDTLTVEKLRCINRCRLRYRAGMGVPRDDLYRLGVSVDVGGAKEVLGFWLDPNREPTLEPNDWRIEYQNEDGGCYVVIFGSGKKGAGIFCGTRKRNAEPLSNP